MNKVLFCFLMILVSSAFSQNKKNEVIQNEVNPLAEKISSIEKDLAVLKREVELQDKSNDKIVQVLLACGGTAIVLILALIGINIYNNRNIARETAKDEVEKVKDKFNRDLNEITEKNREASLLLETLKRAYNVIEDKNKIN